MLIAGNWKMNLTTPEAVALARSVAETAAKRPEVEVVLCSSFTLLSALNGIEGVSLGAQDVFWVEKGAYTGEVSPGMLLDTGCIYCIAGHSERRGRFGKAEVADEHISYFSDTDEVVALKVRALLYAGIKPILCVGETSDEREAGRTEEVVLRQLEAALTGLGPERGEVTVAYEPVWAIGTGNVCDALEANRMCGLIHNQTQLRVLYGGSVNAENAPDLFAQPEIDGALVGGASLKADEFSRIILTPSVENV